MIAGLAICAGFTVVLLLMGWLSAESRPDFLEPNVKHPKFVAPIRPEDL
jgi:hypothetical protein